MARIHKHNVVNISSTMPIIVDLPDLNIKLKEEPVVVSAPIIKPEVIMTVNPVLEYQRLMVEAQVNAKEIAKNAEKDLEKLFNNAQVEGFNKGIEEAKIIIANQQEEIIRDYNKIIDEFQAEKQLLLDKWEDEILSLSLEIARKIINTEIEKNDECMVNIVKKAIDKLANESKVVVKVSPEDLFKFKGLNEIDYKTAKGTVHAKIVCDTSIGSCGCIVETDNGFIDSSVQTQMDKISKILKEGN